MDISNNTLLLIFALGLVLLFIFMKCTFSCGDLKEDFLDQINDPSAPDYVNRYEQNKNNVRWGHPKRHVPVDNMAFAPNKYPGHTGYTHRPACDNPFRNNRMMDLQDPTYRDGYQMTYQDSMDRQIDDDSTNEIDCKKLSNEIDECKAKPKVNWFTCTSLIDTFNTECTGPPPRD